MESMPLGVSFICLWGEMDRCKIGDIFNDQVRKLIPDICNFFLISSNLNFCDIVISYHQSINFMKLSGR